MYCHTVILLASAALISAQSCGPIVDDSNCGCGSFADISSPLQIDGCSNNGPIVQNLPCSVPLGPVASPCSLPLGPGPVIIPQGPSNPVQQQNVVLSNNCNCVKTIVRPKLVQTVVSVPSESQTIQTFTRPVTRTINYQFSPPLNAGPGIPEGPIIDNNNCFVPSNQPDICNSGISGICNSGISGICNSGISGICNSGCPSGCPVQQFLRR